MRSRIEDGVLRDSGFRDRFRTTVNVMSDVFGAGIVDHLSRKDLEDDTV